MYSIVGFQIYSKIMHFSVCRFAPIHIRCWAVGYPPPQMSPLRGGPHVKPQVHSKELHFFHIFKHVTYINYMKLLNFNIISPWELTHTDKNSHKLKNAHFSLHLCTKLMFNITYLKKTKSRHWAWPMPHFHTQVTWAWHIPKYEDNHAETFLPNIKCQTPHMLKCLYSPKQNVKYYLTSLHINEWTLAFTLTWPKTSSVHFLFPLLTLEWFFHYGTPFSQTQLNQLTIVP